jgi:hypothetical protein
MEKGEGNQESAPLNTLTYGAPVTLLFAQACPVSLAVAVCDVLLLDKAA